MQYQVTIDIDEVEDGGGLRGNVDTHQVVVLDDYDEAVTVFNWQVKISEFLIAQADARLFGGS